MQKEIRTRRAKGTGSITYLGEGRRKPYVATFEKKSIGTFKTTEEAEVALLKHQLGVSELYPVFLGDVDYLRTEYAKFLLEFQKKGILDMQVNNLKDIDFYNNLFKDRMVSLGNVLMCSNTKQEVVLTDVPTFSNIWDIEYERLHIKKSESWRYSMAAAFQSLAPLHGIPINLIKTRELQNAFDLRSEKGKCGKSTLTNMLLVCRIIIKYAMKMDYIEKDYSQFINVTPVSEARGKRKPFTIEEIKILMKSESNIAKKILIYIFTGARPIELIEMKRIDVHLNENYMIGGVKTSAGKERVIPIHPFIKPFIEHLFEQYDYPYLFTETCKKGEYTNYNKEFKKYMEELQLNHVEPYDTRYTFSTLAKICHVDTAAHKKIMGHICNNLTDDVYTHEPIEYLLKEITKITI